MADDLQVTDEILDKVREIAAEALDVEPEEVSLDGDLFEDHGLDSIGIVMIHVELALTFGFPEPARGEDLSHIRTVRALSGFVHHRTAVEVPR